MPASVPVNSPAALQSLDLLPPSPSRDVLATVTEFVVRRAM